MAACRTRATLDLYGPRTMGRPSGMKNRDLWVSTRLIELAESADAADGEAVSARQLTVSLAELLAPAEVGFLLSSEAGGMTVRAASSSRARDLASLEVLRGEGPCTDCMTLARPVLNEVVGAADGRWPAFGAKAGAAGFWTVSALPLRHGEHTSGAVSVLAGGNWRLEGSDLYFAEILTRAAALAIVHQRELGAQTRTAEQLQRALDSRVTIEQAKGATAVRLDITPDAAFALLRAYARRESRALADVARQTITGELSAHDLLVRREVNKKRTARPAG